MKDASLQLWLATTNVGRESRGSEPHEDTPISTAGIEIVVPVLEPQTAAIV
jgi:hypothetical protein